MAIRNGSLYAYREGPFFAEGFPKLHLGRVFISLIRKGLRNIKNRRIASTQISKGPFFSIGNGLENPIMEESKN